MNFFATTVTPIFRNSVLDDPRIYSRTSMDSSKPWRGNGWSRYLRAATRPRIPEKQKSRTAINRYS